MPKASDLKRGAVVEIDGQVYITRDIDVRSPSSRGSNTLYKVRFIGVKTKQKLEQTFKGDDFIKDGDLVRRQVQFSYREADSVTFMDSEDYSQHVMDAEDIEDEMRYISEELEGIMALLVDGAIAGIELPQAVVLVITDTAPGIKGASATARTKPATLSTGMEVQVPEYLDVGERIKVNTGTGKFMSRG